MSEIGRVGGRIPGDLRQILQTAPDASEAEPGDLATLGMLVAVIETAGQRTEPGSSLHDLFARLAELGSCTILSEVADPAAAAAFLFATVSDLASEAETEAFAVADLLRQADVHLGRAEETPDDTPAEPSGPSTAAAPECCDAVQINSDQDAVVYTEFISESGDHLEVIETRVLELETNPGDVDLINEMFRCFHSMKGAAGFLGLATFNRLCHEVETMLDRARKLSLRVDHEVVEVLLASIDLSKQMLAALQIRLDHARGVNTDGVAPYIDIGPVLAAVQVVLSRKPSRIVYDEEEATPHPDRLGGILLAEGSIQNQHLQEALAKQRKPLGEILVEMGAASTDQVESALNRQQAKPRSTGSIKVDTARLDRLMEMVGELVIAETQVEQDPQLRRDDAQALARNVDNLGKITRNLQELVMAMRLVPLRQTFHKMIRLVRDTSQKTGKKTRLEIRGEDTEIDKTVVEEIADPLVHLLRNAVDHGIEPPEQRLTAGKAEEGLVTLEAFHDSGHVVIEIGDDGRGLDCDRILAKAVEKGLVHESQTLSEEEIRQFIFAPGFSTHAVATDISGRGVGMDVVKRNIERLGGQVHIRSAPGQGSTFSVRLPLTMAIVDGMVVRCGQQTYVIPTLAIEESLRPAADQLCTVAGRGETITVRGSVLPLVRLHELFAVQKACTDVRDGLVVLLDQEGKRCALLVDALLGQQQVVIKGLGNSLKGLRGISGACILGDGRVGLILDISSLIRLSGA